MFRFTTESICLYSALLLCFSLFLIFFYFFGFRCDFLQFLLLNLETSFSFVVVLVLPSHARLWVSQEALFRFLVVVPEFVS